jgi:riboflavin kinase/FMN adenylyltransferase
MDQLPRFNNAVVTIGTFDGVHRGHKQILRQLQEKAQSVNGTPVVVTFYPHPKRVLASDLKPVFLLNTPEERNQLLHEAGIQHIVVVPFTEAFAAQTAREYIASFLVQTLQVKHLIIGYDHKFGHNREGDYHLLDQLAGSYGFTVTEIPEKILQDVTISSTRIREALLHGNIQQAEAFLGYPYFFTGTVVEGNKLGRTIGYPTANMQLPLAEKLIPANGVYAVTVASVQLDKHYKGMMNIGLRPTVGGSTRTIEVHLLDFDGDLYGAGLTITLHRYLRAEIKFDGLEALKKQLAQDKLATIASFS